ncbi:MAG: ABC transporter permease [Paracoccaceae bacterium]
MLFSLAWRNLWRRRTRTNLSLASMAFTSALLVFMLSFQLGTYETMKTNTLRIMDGYAQVQQPGYSDDPELDNYIENAAEVATLFGQIAGITAATPRTTSFVILARGEISYGAAIFGIDPATEPNVSTLGNTVTVGRYLQNGDDAAIVIGDAMARNLGVTVGDHITLLGSAADRSIAADSLLLVGLFHTGLTQMDRQLAQMPLARFQDTFAMPGGAHLIALSGKNLAAVNAALPDLNQQALALGLITRDWAELQPALKQAITLDASTSLTIYLSLIVVVVFIILNTMLMAVLERTREFGVLLAIGMKPGLLGRMMWIELVMLAALGNALGILLGGAVAVYFQFQGIAFAGMEGMMAQFGLPGRLYPTVSLVSLLTGPVIIVLAVAIGGIVPYQRLRRLEPVAAMGAA